MLRTALLLAVTLFGCAKALPVMGEIPDFSLTDQTGRPVTRSDLFGSVWVANFIYTGCGTACPMLTKRLSEIGTSVRRVSFTVDPEVDTPERLKSYAERFGASPENWSFLSGPVDEIRRTVSEGFKLAYQKTSEADVFHSEKLVVIDAKGRIRGYFDANPDGIAALRRAVLLLKEES